MRKELQQSDTENNRILRKLGWDSGLHEIWHIFSLCFTSVFFFIIWQQKHVFKKGSDLWLSSECVYVCGKVSSPITHHMTLHLLLDSFSILLISVEEQLYLSVSASDSLTLSPQVVTNRDTQETLLCMACVFEVSNSEHGAQHHIYRLVKEWSSCQPADLSYRLWTSIKKKSGSASSSTLTRSDSSSHPGEAYCYYYFFQSLLMYMCSMFWLQLWITVQLYYVLIQERIILKEA